MHCPQSRARRLTEPPSFASKVLCAKPVESPSTAPHPAFPLTGFENTRLPAPTSIAIPPLRRTMLSVTTQRGPT
jgi:hypothetical protein